MEHKLHAPTYTCAHTHTLTHTLTHSHAHTHTLTRVYACKKIWLVISTQGVQLKKME